MTDVGDPTTPGPGPTAPTGVADLALADLLRHRGAAAGPAEFIQEIDGPSISIGETLVRAEDVASRLLRLDVSHGDTVVLVAKNSIEAVVAWFGISIVGATDVSVNPALRGEALAHALSSASAKIVLVDAALVTRVLEVAGRSGVEEILVLDGRTPVSPEGAGVRVRSMDEIDPYDHLPDATNKPSDTASVVFTSGTSGPAKGAQMPYGQTGLLARTTVEGLHMGPDDVFYLYHPLHHMAGKFMGVQAALIAGAKVVIAEQFDPDSWLADVRRAHATVTIAHGPMIEQIFATTVLDDDWDNPLRALVAVPLPAHIAESFETRFHLRALEVWGMTEVSVVTWTPYNSELIVGSCGRVLDEHYEVLIAEPGTDIPRPQGQVGEILVRPRRPWTVSTGYINNAEATVAAWQNLWFHTGDLARIDTAGNVFFAGRSSERIRRRAENISPYDIEIATLAYTGVLEAAAVGVQSAYTDDDEVKVCVTVDRDFAGAAGLLRHLAGALPHHMVPRFIDILDNLPRTPTNKIKKHLLREAGVGPNTWDRSALGVSLKEIIEGTDDDQLVPERSQTDRTEEEVPHDHDPFH